VIEVYYDKKDDSSILLGKVNTFEEAADISMKYLAEHGIKSYYQRYWQTNNYVKMDFGSHTEFIRFVPKTSAERGD
jgi:hypothetical protein